jgi:hypothetical protein
MIKRDNRTLRVTDLPQCSGFDSLPTSLDISITYDNCASGANAIQLDNVVIPRIVELLERHGWQDSTPLAREKGSDDPDTQLDEIQQSNTAGLRLIALLNLPVKDNGRVDTDWGDKTPAGLARTVERVITEAGDKTL